jgi:hypothetical protein
VQIDCLANWPGLIPELAALLHQEWADLYQAAGIDQAQLQQVLTERTAVDTLPITHYAGAGQRRGIGRCRQYQAY